MRVGRSAKAGKWKRSFRADFERRRLRKLRLREIREVEAARRRALKQRHLEAIERAAERFDTYA